MLLPTYVRSTKTHRHHLEVEFLVTKTMLVDQDSHNCEKLYFYIVVLYSFDVQTSSKDHKYVMHVSMCFQYVNKDLILKAV